MNINGDAIFFFLLTYWWLCARSRSVHMLLLRTPEFIVRNRTASFPLYTMGLIFVLL